MILTLLLATTVFAVDVERPNIVLILADDIGYGDVGCYGATKVKTPNIDRLARQGRRFTDAHSPSSVCTPTRYAILTGQYGWRHAPAAGILSGVSPLAIPENRPTLAKLLRDAGYRTGAVGKWHLGLGASLPTDYNRETSPGPKNVGFDYSFLIPATGDRVPCVFVENQKVVGLDPSNPIQVRYDQPIGEEPTGAKRPDLLTLHPSHGHDNTIVDGVSRIGYMQGGKSARWKDDQIADVITQKAVDFLAAGGDRPFFLYFATHDIHVPRVPSPRFRGKSECGVRGDAIVELDWSVGQILDALDRLKLTGDTLVVFTSDNGGVIDDGYQDGALADLNGHRVNGDLRGFKGQLFEGGHRVPFVVRWPGRVPSGVSDQLICHVDLMATIASVVDRPLAQDAGPDSVSVLPAWLGDEARPVRDHLVMHTNGASGARAIREGDWKWIPAPAGKRQSPASAAGQLYNLRDDPREEHNVAAGHPDIAARLVKRLRQIEDSGHSRPPNRS